MSKTTMFRSQTQLATIYAPDKHFTFEGGAGACKTVPVRRPDPGITAAERNQIREGVLEFVQSWWHRASRRQTPPVLPEQALDESAFLNRDRLPHFDQGKFEYCKPDRMAYVPDPLALVCRHCAVVHVAKLDELAPDQARFAGVRTCPDSSDGKHEWRQIDVVFAHWSGRVDPLSPFRKDINTSNGRITQQYPGRCDAGGSCEFKLHKGRSGQFRDWYFHCHCGERRELRQKDENTLRWLVDRYGAEPGETLREINMLPVSYRANSLYYVQSEQIISHDSIRHIDFMAEGREIELQDLLLKLYAYPGQDVEDVDVVKALRAVGQPDADSLADDIEDVLAALNSLEKTGPEVAISSLKERLRQHRQTAQDRGWVSTAPIAPPALQHQVRARTGFARKFDPIRLGVEHDVLREEQIDAPVAKDAVRPVVDLASPDVDLQPKGEEAERRRALERVIERKEALGLVDLKLLRNLKMLQYSFGYSRVSPSPTTVQKGLTMPVRICGFPTIGGRKRPIYVLRQSNEAVYVRLDEARVSSWLERNGLGGPIARAPNQRLGGKLIETYQDFGRFAEAYSETSGSRPRDPVVFVFGLLHTMAHQCIHVFSRFSGLDLGSFGERVFPADLAFIVYRKGMTPDLGNIAAMWRNHGLDVLSALDDPRALRCGSGSLCNQRGGACPACIMIPEVSCLTGNNILSRAFLAGGRAMAWDMDASPIQGFFD